MEHDKAFRDSPEERQLYEMGLEVSTALLVALLFLGS